MKSIFLFPLLAGAVLFSGCEALVVEDRPYRGAYHSDRGYYGRDRGYYERDRGDYYRSRPAYYSDRRDYGYAETRSVYSTPYRTRSSYGRSREINRVQVVSPRGYAQRTVVREVSPGHYRKKKKDDRDHR